MCNNGTWDILTKWLGDMKRVVDPVRVTYVRNPLMDDPGAGLVGNRAPVARSTKIKPVDDLPVWSVFCVRVRSGFRGRGISHQLVAGAVDLARSHGAPAVEAIPVDNRGKKVDLTMAFVGTRTLFEHAGFSKVADTDSVTDGFPRVVMRLSLD